jgi:hypothetical protein
MRKLNKYLEENDKAADGGIVDLGEYGKEVKQDEGFNHGPAPLNDLLQKGKDATGLFEKPNLMTTYGQPKQPENLIKNYPRQAKVIGGTRMAEGGIVSPYPENRQMLEEEKPGEAFDEGEDEEYTKMWPGGIVGDDEDRPQDASYTPKSLDLSDLTQNQAPIAGPDFNTPQIAPQAQKQPVQQAQEPAQPPQPPPQLPGMPPGTNPDEIAQYIQGQKKKIGQYGPEQQLELQNQLINQKQGLGNRLVSGAKGFSDALMQGVARAGNPGNQQAFENQLNEQGNQQMGTLARAGEQNMQQIGANQKMDAMDSKSPLSKMAQQSFGPILQRYLHITPENVSKMSAAQMEMAGELGMKGADIETQNALKVMGLQLQELQTKASIQNQQAGQEIAKEGKQLEKEGKQQTAAKSLQDRPWYQKAIEAVVPHSWESESTKTMEAQLPGHEPSPVGEIGIGQTIQHPSGAKITRHK